VPQTCVVCSDMIITNNRN